MNENFFFYFNNIKLEIRIKYTIESSIESSIRHLY